MNKLSLNEDTLSEEDYNRVQQVLAEQEWRVVQERQAAHEAWLKPLQEFVHAEVMEEILSEANKLFTDPMTLENRSVNIALGEFIRSVEALKANVPSTEKT